LSFSGNFIELVFGLFLGGFDWHLDFFWEYLPAQDIARRMRDPTRSFPTPAIAGGLFAINKEWFIEIGTYDSGMEVGLK
jgi:polypeptide N-acetylgalactosaminyltransferase